eukprot:2364479-Alexandrium_andersonii.AAC.1
MKHCLQVVRCASCDQTAPTCGRQAVTDAIRLPPHEVHRGPDSFDQTHSGAHRSQAEPNCSYAVSGLGQSFWPVASEGVSWALLALGVPAGAVE